MLNDEDSNRVMILLDTISQDSIIHSHLTQMYRERDIQLFYDLLELVYRYGNDMKLRTRLKELAC